jgi:hypothetical protein
LTSDDEDDDDIDDVSELMYDEDDEDDLAINASQSPYQLYVTQLTSWH